MMGSASSEPVPQDAAAGAGAAPAAAGAPQGEEVEGEERRCPPSLGELSQAVCEHSCLPRLKELVMPRTEGRGQRHAAASGAGGAALSTGVEVPGPTIAVPDDSCSCSLAGAEEHTASPESRRSTPASCSAKSRARLRGRRGHIPREDQAEWLLSKTRRFSEPAKDNPDLSSLRTCRRRSEPSVKWKSMQVSLTSSFSAPLPGLLGALRRSHRLQSFQRGALTPVSAASSCQLLRACSGLSRGTPKSHWSEGSSPAESCRASLSPNRSASQAGTPVARQAFSPRRQQRLSISFSKESAGPTTPCLGAAEPPGEPREASLGGRLEEDQEEATADKLDEGFQDEPQEKQDDEQRECDTISSELRLRRVDSYLMSLDGDDFESFRAALLANCLCMGMGDREVLELSQTAELFRFNAGEQAVAAGSPGTHFFVVKDGAWSVAAADGGRWALGPGDSFGEVPLVHRCRQLVTVRAEDGGACWGIGRDAFRRILRSLVERTYQENLALLGRMALFRCLGRRQRAALCSALAVQIFTQGTCVVHEGTAHGDCLFLVRSGSLEVTIGGQRVATLGPGDHFGERALLYRETRSATVSALEPTTLCAVRRELLEEALGKELQGALWRSVILTALRDLHLPFPDAQAVASACTVCDFPARSAVVQEPSQARGLRFLVVLDGEVAVYCPDEPGGRRILGRGSCFGLEYLSGNPPPFRHTILNESDSLCKLALLSADAVLALSAPEAKEAHALNERLVLVRSVYVFRHLSSRHCELLAKSLRVVAMGRGTKVIEEGDLGSLFYAIKSGELLVTKRLATDGERSVRTLGKSDYFGERGLLYDRLRTATVTCSSEVVELMVIDKAVFLHVARDKMLHQLEERIRLQQTDVAMEDLRVVKILGRGSYGVVKLVEHRTCGTRYALKCIGRAEAARNGQQENLRLEREILLENDHPFIVKVLRTFKDKRFLYFLTELVTGGELYSVIRAIGILSRQQAQFYGGSLILALESLHERSIAYRDLKPENVMLDSHGFTKLIDFGCAAKLKGISRTMVGTPHYIAPEVILGNGYWLTCDVWSLGVCLYEFMCGPLPFGNDLDDPIQVFREILLAKVRFPLHVKDSSSTLLMRQLLRRPLELRLGCGKLGWRAVKRHPFFRGFGFDRLFSRAMEPPLVPEAAEEEEEEGQAEAAEESASGSESSALTDVESEVGQEDGRLPPLAEDTGWDKDF